MPSRQQLAIELARGDGELVGEDVPPQNVIIVDKVITGCGATTEALADNVPTILTSPRSALLGCKVESDQFKGKAYLFRNEEDTYNKPFEGICKQFN